MQRKFGTTKGVDNESWSPYVAKLKADVSSVSSRANEDEPTLEMTAVKSVTMANSCKIAPNFR